MLFPKFTAEPSLYRSKKNYTAISTEATRVLFALVTQQHLYTSGYALRYPLTRPKWSTPLRNSLFSAKPIA